METNKLATPGKRHSCRHMDDHVRIINYGHGWNLTIHEHDPDIPSDSTIDFYMCHDINCCPYCGIKLDDDEFTSEELEQLKEIREVRTGMSWGTQEHGIEQLTEREVFLLKLLEKSIKRGSEY